MALKPKRVSERLNALPKWARDYIHHVQTLVGAPEIEDLAYYRDENRMLRRLVSDLKRENGRLTKRLQKKPRRR